MKILVTAGTSGLGEAIVRRMAGEAGDEILFTYHSSKQSACEIVHEYKNTRAFHCDFSNAGSVADLVSEISAWQPDVLVNNAYAGAYSGAHFHKTGIDELSGAFNNSILPTLQVTQAAIHVFRKKKAGKIITILSSVLFEETPIGASVYAAGKAYLERMVKAWATENKKFNIRSYAISPSFMLTKGHAGMDERLIEQITDAQPGKRLLEPAEAAELVYKMIHTEYTNGINLLINPMENVV